MVRLARSFLGFLAVLTAAQEGDLRLRVSVHLVQVDATVTDARGKVVTGLAKDDFRLYLDGQQQPLQSCTFIPLRETGAGPAHNSQSSVRPGAILGAPASIPRNEVRRTIVLFVDDLSMSSESIPQVHNGVRKFVTNQLQEGDLVAIIRASAGLGALQDFSSDKRLLLAAADQIRWRPGGKGAGQAYQQIGNDPSGALMAPDLRQAEDNGRTIDYTLAAASALRRVVHGMARLPGRKSVTVLSGYFPFNTPDEIDPAGSSAVGSGAFVAPVVAAMRRVVDEAVRSGVTVYAIDTRGISSLTLGAADRIGANEGGNPRMGAGPADLAPMIRGAAAGRRSEYREAQWGAAYLANETGGFMINEANRIDAGLERIMNDQSGYYLLAFTPPASALTPGKDGQADFHRVKVEVQRAGLTVRTPRGFFGVADENREPAAHPELELAAAIDSALTSTDIRMRVQTAYLYGKKKNEFLIQTAAVLDGRDIQLTGPPNNQQGVVHLIVRAYDAQGRALEGGIDQVRRISLNEEGTARALRYGLVYSVLLPANAVGAYRIRAACRDESTGKLGTGTDFVFIPKLEPRKVALSGVVFEGMLGTEGHVVPASAPLMFKPGDRVKFALELMNPEPSVELSARIVRDEAVLLEMPAKPISVKAQNGRAFVHEQIGLPPDLAPGEYTVLVDVNGAKTWGRISVGAGDSRIY